jgi:hypothetical protein
VDAVKVYVFGFGRQEKGSAIRAYLEEAGSTIVMAADADADSSGGCIETNIVTEGELACGVDAIRKAVHDVCPEARLRWYEYDLVHEGADEGDDRPSKLRLHPA